MCFVIVSTTGRMLMDLFIYFDLYFRERCKCLVEGIDIIDTGFPCIVIFLVLIDVLCQNESKTVILLLLIK